MKCGAGADAAIVEKGKEQSDCEAEKQAGKKNGLASNAIELKGIELGKNVGGKFSNDHGLPRTNDEVGEKHDPSSEITDERREDLRGVGGFAGGVGEAANPLAVDVADGKKKDAAEAETKHGAKWPATGEPVVHENDPASTDHGAEAEGKIIGEAELAGECGHVVKEDIRNQGSGNGKQEALW